MVLRYKEQLGAVMAKRRGDLGLTQKDVAEAAHVKEAQTVSRWERGLSMPSDLEAVARALKTTIPELMSGIAPPRRVARKLDIAPAGDPDSQLDRIENKLDRLLTALSPEEEAAGVIEDAQRLAGDAGRGAGESPGRSAGAARASQRRAKARRRAP